MDPYLQETHVLNHIHEALEIRYSKNKGRGVFTTQDLKKGDILIVEKPLA